MSLSGVVCLRWLCKRGQIDWTWKMLSFRHIHNTSAHQRTHTLTRSGQTKCAWSWIHDHWSWYGFQIDFCSHLSLCRHTLRVCEWCSLVLLLCCLALPCLALLNFIACHSIRTAFADFSIGPLEREFFHQANSGIILFGSLLLLMLLPPQLLPLLPFVEAAAAAAADGGASFQSRKSTAQIVFAQLYAILRVIFPCKLFQSLTHRNE